MLPAEKQVGQVPGALLPQRLGPAAPHSAGRTLSGSGGQSHLTHPLPPSSAGSLEPGRCLGYWGSCLETASRTWRFSLITPIQEKTTMLTSVKILLISNLFSLLLIGSHGKEILKKTTTQSIAAGLKTMENESVPLESDTNSNSDKENKETSNPKASNSSLWDPSNKHHGTTEVFNNASTNNFSGNLRPTPMFPTDPPLVHSFVSKLPRNSSIADENPPPVSAPPNATSAMSSEKFTWPSASETMKTPDNSSISVSILPAAPNTMTVTPMATEPDEWLTTSNDSFIGFTPYRETTTLQPTLKFTNNSKIFSNTSDPQEENKNTGVVFGAILGAILGASLLSLVGYLLCGKRKTDSFSHRRLYDDRNEPVLRLDNAPEPYDASFGNSSYYNSTVNDSSVPAGQENARDGIPMDDIPQLRTSV
ncbi:mucin-15 isoform X1 [Canis lupus familiaris]|uniref:Mucin 15, cell surface associated n=2 Tax=Canis lupus familiaris TaxID=9615 RepID=A0A8C0Q680_CANLF|nr:mucin-15 isoform X1 [Canis lupus familiaris]XP_025315589.3 mucin-15 isoform X1 [Canis lupus dingo]XP_038286647.1 mucin-15 isoform X1 [Canis lupus familiaris]XP_038425206.1 mucin-15 isoform X1 [Canis lupus familiaris]|eukprot:XP_005633818.1 mucin-15 isoform X1 [Canis lupus familiaris]